LSIDVHRFTLPAKDWLMLLRVLQGGTDPVFQVNTLAIELLARLGVSARMARPASRPLAT
jgi:hypothetical protein